MKQRKKNTKQNKIEQNKTKQNKRCFHFSFTFLSNLTRKQTNKQT